MQQPFTLPPCPTCGAPRQALESRFCVKCGAPLPVLQPAPTAMPMYPPVYPPMMPAAPQPKKRTKLWVTLGVLAVLLGCTAIVVITNALAILDRGGALF